MTATGTVAELTGVQLGSRSVSYTARDAIGYALTVGARATDLDLVYERDLRVLPTYGLALGLWAVEAAGELGAYDRLKSLHASQRLTVLSSLPREGTLEMTSRVSNVWDKGKAAMIEIEVSCAQFLATYSIFLPGYGGWGGARGQGSAAAANEHNALTTPFSTDYVTSQDLAAQYRLTGDLHPVHIDPAVAAGYGFAKPILHGLCTLGIAARTVATTVGAHPAELTGLQARFAAPVYPGAVLTMAGESSTATAGTRAVFTASVGDSAVLSGGTATFARTAI